VRWVIDALDYDEEQVIVSADADGTRPCPRPRHRHDHAARRGERLKGISKAKKGATRVYTHKTGDTLISIARHELGDASRWPEIKKLNPKLRDPRKKLKAHTPSSCRDPRRRHRHPDAAQGPAARAHPRRTHRDVQPRRDRRHRPDVADRIVSAKATLTIKGASTLDIGIDDPEWEIETSGILDTNDDRKLDAFPVSVDNLRFSSSRPRRQDAATLAT
jgi:hypothetical protein